VAEQYTVRLIEPGPPRLYRVQTPRGPYELEGAFTAEEALQAGREMCERDLEADAFCRRWDAEYAFGARVGFADLAALRAKERR